MEKETIHQWNAPEIDQAYEKLEKMSQDPRFKWSSESRRKALLDHLSSMKDHFVKGRELGQKEGERKEKLRFASGAFQKSMSLS